MGIDVKLVTADEAHYDSDGFVYKEIGACIIAPPLG